MLSVTRSSGTVPEILALEKLRQEDQELEAMVRQDHSVDKGTSAKPDHLSWREPAPVCCLWSQQAYQSTQSPYPNMHTKEKKENVILTKES